MPPAGAYGQSHVSTQQGLYSTFNNSRPWYQPEICHSRSKHRSHHRQPTPPTTEDDASKEEDTGLASTSFTFDSSNKT